MIEYCKTNTACTHKECGDNLTHMFKYNTLSVESSNSTVISKQGLDNWGSPVWCKLTVPLTFNLNSYHWMQNSTKVLMYLCIIYPDWCSYYYCKLAKSCEAQKVQVSEQLKGLISKYGQEIFWPSSIKELTAKHNGYVSYTAELCHFL